MYENIKYTSKQGEDFVLNGDSPDFLEDFSHKVLFSIENVTSKQTFSYYISIAHPLWEFSWQITPDNEQKVAKVKEIYLEKAKRLIDSGKHEFLEITLTPVNTSKNLDEALKNLKEV